MMTAALVLLTLLFWLTLESVAEAHSPVFLSDGRKAPVRLWREVRDPEPAQAFYGRLPAGAAADIIPIQARKGQTIYLRMLVPNAPAFAGFQPRVVLVGPQLEGVAPSDLPVPLEPGEGILPVPGMEPPEITYEPFTQVRYRVQGMLQGTYPATGRYKMVIYDPGCQGGPYTAALGRRERFGLRDMLIFPLVWTRVRTWLWK